MRIAAVDGAADRLCGSEDLFHDSRELSEKEKKFKHFCRIRIRPDPIETATGSLDPQINWKAMFFF